MAQRNSIRVRSALLAVPVIGALAFSGCSNGGDAPDGEGAGSFSLTYPKVNDSETHYEDIVALYVEETGADVELLPIQGDAYNTALATQIQGGNAGDVLVVPPGSGAAVGVLTLAEADLLAPLSGAPTEIIPAGTEALYTVGNEVYGMPPNLSPSGVVWNPDTAASIGIDEFPATFEDLLDDCAIASEAGRTMFVLAGAVPPNLGLSAQVLSASRVYAATPDWNTQRSAGDVTFADSEGWRNVLEDFQALNEAGCFQAGAEGAGFDAITSGLASGSAVAAVLPGGAAGAISTQAGVKLEVQPMPGRSGEKPWVIASPLLTFAVNAKADEAARTAGQAFLDWLAEPANYTEFANMTATVPVAGAAESELLPQYAPIGELISSGSISNEPNIEWPNAGVYEALSVGTQGLLTGQRTVDEVLESLDTAWDQ